MPVKIKKYFLFKKFFYKHFFAGNFKEQNFFFNSKKINFTIQIIFFHSLLSTFPQHELRRNIDLLFFIYIPCNMSDNNLSN